eukprot:10589371-Alexandrium_andersonii.AAC.1
MARMLGKNGGQHARPLVQSPWHATPWQRQLQQHSRGKWPGERQGPTSDVMRPGGCRRARQGARTTPQQPK